MNKEEIVTAEETTLFILKALPVRDQFRITTYLTAILQAMTPSPSTRWYDCCNLRWPNDRQSYRMDRYVTLYDIHRRMTDGEPLRRIISRDGRWIGFRWKFRIRKTLKEMACFNVANSERL